MREHIDEIEDNDIQWVVHQLVEIVENLLPEIGIQDLGIGIFEILAVTLEILAEQLLLELVLAAVVALVEPHLRIFFRDDGGHQAGKEGIARIMRGSGQDAVAKGLVIYIIIVVQNRIDAPPLVVAQVINDKQERGFALF